jgi:3-hydroxyacyl-CoA dehydrogenase/enoyl-CoA hydratase/3-hydroxybutyryl-CoA epimerase/3-hydroxyacyl-CoA dehydrogenase/enoyl-CoA hydratase/3-hydroxybutyryl-CoA epimerase/enoyl-CoA isomerase
MEWNRNDTGVERPGVAARGIRRVGILGAGVMGRAIAAANLMAGICVTITDADSDVLARCAEEVLNETSRERPSASAESACLLRVTPEVAGLTSCDLVIESVVESLEVKRRILTRLEPVVSDDSILASNTSTIRIAQLAQTLRRPQRFCGIHFCNPVSQRKLVEVVRGDNSDDETVAAAVVFAKSLGKMPIVVNDAPGFVVNRLLFPYLNESLELIREGADIRAIERAATDFGMPMGPLEFCDTIGVDTAFYAGRVMWDAYRARIVASPILPALIRTGRLGRKTGRGFFAYPQSHGLAQLDPTLDAILEPYLRRQRSFSQDDLTARLFLPMLNEATRVIGEAVVRDPRDIDLAMIFGLGFSADKGGLLFWADQLGVPAIVTMLKRLESLGPRAEPSPNLTEMAQRGRNFYGSP